MKKLAILFACTLAASAWSQTHVKPHVRADGTYVEGYYRSTPNRTVDDNYSTRGNQNPYTGQQGTEPRSYERPPQPVHTQPSYGQHCAYNSSGQYICR